MHDQRGPGGNTAYTDVWDALVGEGSHAYTEVLHRHFLPLFEEGLNDIRRRFDRLINLHRNELPYSLRTLLLRAGRQLEGEQVAYRLLPQFAQMPALDPTLFLNARFAGVIGVLSQVSRESDRLRQNLRTRQAGPI